MEWVKCFRQMPPRNGKFLFYYYYGIGIGEWGQCYTVINGNSERTHESYICVLWPSEIIDGQEPYQWGEDMLIELEVSWMPLPEAPKE